MYITNIKINVNRKQIINNILLHNSFFFCNYETNVHNIKLIINLHINNKIID